MALPALAVPLVAAPDLSRRASALPRRYALVDTWPGGRGRSLYEPGGVDVAADGIIVVVEKGGDRVDLLHADGTAEAVWGGTGSGPGEFRRPEDVAVDLEGGRVLVADTGNRRVQVLGRRTGEATAIWTDVGLPRGLALAADGTAYVADAEGHRVLAIAPDGSRVAEWGTFGRGPGDFDTPLGVAVGDDGLVYVADSGNQRVQWFTPDGAVAGSLNLDNSTGPGGIPLDVGVAAAGDLYVVVDRGVLLFRGRTRYADILAPPGPKGPGRAQGLVNHEGLRGVAVRPGVGVYYTFAPATGSPDQVVAMPERWFPSAILGSVGVRAMDDPGRIDAGRGSFVHLLDSTGQLRIFDDSGRVYDGFHSFPGGPGTDIAGLADASAVLAANGVTATWLTCFANCPPPPATAVLDANMMQRQDCRGALVEDDTWWNRSVTSLAAGRHAVLSAGYSTVVVRDAAVAQPLGAIRLVPRTAAFRSFSDVAYDAFGNLAVLARDGEVLRFDERGRALASLSLAALDRRGAESLAVAADGRLFVLTTDEWVLAYDPAGRLEARWSVAVAAGPGTYTDLAVDGAGRILVPDGAGNRVLVFAESGPPQDPPEGDGAACDVSVAKTADPQQLPLGDTTTVTLTVDAACPTSLAALDIVVVVDTGCDMSGERLRLVREAGARLAAGLAQDTDRVAVVTFAPEYDGDLGGARLALPFTSSREELTAVLRGLDTVCLPFLESRRNGLEDGLRVAREALVGPGSRAEAGKVVIALSPGRPDRDLALWEARQLWRMGVQVFTVAVGQDSFCAGRPPDKGLLAALASEASGFRDAADPDDLVAIYDELGRSLSGRRLFETLVVTDRIPANMRLVPGSAQPVPDIDGDGTLEWRFEEVALGERPSVSYILEPLAAGRWPTNVEAAAGYRDGLGQAGRVLFPVPEVEVVAPTPTVAPVSPTPEVTATAVPSATPSGTASPAPTARPAGPRRLFLPVALAPPTCVAVPRALDVALAVDVSSSMAGANLDAARGAAGAFVDVLVPGRDRVAVIAFDRHASVEQPLSGDIAAATGALARLSPGLGTRLDRGLAEALSQVARGPRPGAAQAVLVMSDGLQEGGARSEVMAVADLARELGVTVYALGFGARIDPEIMVAAAGSPERFMVAPSPAALGRIHSELTRPIPCP